MNECYYFVGVRRRKDAKFINVIVEALNFNGESHDIWIVIVSKRRKAALTSPHLTRAGSVFRYWIIYARHEKKKTELES